MFLPANGGLPTMTSKPPFARVKTSGNSICQWNGGIGRSCSRKPSAIARQRVLRPRSAALFDRRTQPLLH